MRRRQTANVAKRRALAVLMPSEEEKVGHGAAVDGVADDRMHAQRRDRRGEDERRLAAREVERLRPEGIARAEQLARIAAPDREREIAEEMRRTFVAPSRECQEHELVIGAATRRAEEIGERVAVIEADVAGDEGPAVERVR